MKKILLILVILTVLAAIPVTVFLVKQNQDVRSRAKPATTLSFKPSSITKAVGESFTLEAVIETAENYVYVAKIDISYDASKLEAVSITNGPLFPQVRTAGVVDPATGTLSIVLTAEDENTPVTGTGTAAIVKFKAISATSTPSKVQFITPDTIVGAKDETTNVLVGTTPASITITDATGASLNQLTSTGSSPTPTSAYTAPTPTPNLTYSSPTPIGSITATPTPVGSADTTITITAPVLNSVQKTSQPTVRGHAPSNTSVTVVFYPGPITAVVTADSTGSYTYTTVDPLTDGPYDVVTSVQDTSGNTHTATSSFVVSAASTGTSTQSVTPVSGNVSITFILILVGSILTLTGILLPIIRS